MRFAALLVLCNACSFIFVSRAPEHPEQMQSFDCTTSRVAPALDAIWGGLNLAGALIASGKSDYDFNSGGPSRSETIGVGVAWALVSGASAIYGFAETDKCENALRGAARTPPQPVSWAPSTGRVSGCSKDTDCKGDRICEHGSCVDATPPPPPAMPPPSAPDVPVRQPAIPGAPVPSEPAPSPPN